MARKKSCGALADYPYCATEEVDLYRMLFGHNTDIRVGETVYHLQTEDRGPANALIDTTVYCRGRVLHRQTNNYFDLMPLDPERTELLKKRIIEQHRTVAEEVRSGILHLVPPPLSAQEMRAGKTAAVSHERSGAEPVLEVSLELINAKKWLEGKRANLHVAVRKKQNGEAIARALVTARVDGAAEVREFSTETGVNGEARLEFEMPQLAGAESALVIEAKHADSKSQLRFQLRARPRVPTA